MLPGGKGAGIARQPHWQVRFKNGAVIISRLPNKDGKGVKGCIAGARTFTPVGAPADAEPMLIPGALVLTKRGNIPIEDVIEGDEVVTHKGRWRAVTATFKGTAAPTVEVAGAGHRGLVMSQTHAMFARRNRNPQCTRNLEDPTWLTPACEAAEGQPERWYFGSPVTVPDVGRPWMPHPNAESLLALAGAYVADGCRLRHAILITDHEQDMQRLVGLTKELGLGHGIHDHSRVGNRAKRFTIHESGVGKWLCKWIFEEFGELSAGKRVPVWLLCAPRSQQAAFLDSYMAGDGHWDEAKGSWTLSSASKELVIGLRLLGQALGYTCSYSWSDPKVTHIMGVELKKAPRRSHRLTLTLRGRNAVVEDGVTWQKIRSVAPGPQCDVYDLSVDEDHSYVVDGLISHNQHVVELDIDEAQDYPPAGWREVVETLNAGDPDSIWCCHGVSRGVRDSFFEKTQANSGWKVHRPMAMHRGSWGAKERENKVIEYGGSRQSVDYKRNIYGEHGDASNSVFVLAKLMAVVDLDEGSTYNSDVYEAIKIELERFPAGAGPDERAALLYGWIQPPGEHLNGYTQRVANREVGSPRGYSSYWAGMDVGVTNHPSEILVCGQRAGTELLELLLRIQMHRINTSDQKLVVEYLFRIYPNLRLAIDKTGVGFPVWQELTEQSFGDRVFGFGFSEKRVVAFEDRPLEGNETIKDLALMRNVVEASTDWLRNNYVDSKLLRLPYDREILIEMQGQTYTVIRDNGDPYGQRRQFAGGSFHTLDAMKMLVAGKHIPPLEAMLDVKPEHAPVLDVFMGM